MNYQRTNTIARISVAFVGLLSLGMALSPMAHAEVLDWNLLKLQVFFQDTNNLVPTTASYFEIESNVRTTVPGDFTTVTLEDGPNDTVDYPGRGGGRWNIVEEFSDQSALDAAYPNQLYHIEAEGPLGDFAEPITLAGSFPTEIPFFTGNTYNDLQDMDTAQAVTLTWNTPPAAGFFLSIESDATGDEAIFIDGSGNSTQTSFVVPAGTLAPGTAYDLFLAFVGSQIDDPRTGFASGAGFVGFANDSELEFTTGVIPEPASALLFLCGTALLVGFRKRI